MSTPAPPIPPSIDSAEIRRKLAGLVDHSSRVPSPAETEEVKILAVRFVNILANLFGDSLDRATLWDRIDSAIATSVQKSAPETSSTSPRSASHIDASPSRVAACIPLLQVIEQVAVRPQDWRANLLAHMNTRRFVVIAFARSRWQLIKSGEAEL